MKILCTGNPDHVTVASAIRRKFPQAEFASRSTEYDLRFWDAGSEDFFRSKIKDYSVFINSSFVCNGGQLALLETTWDVWTKNNIKGHIINIGSTAEWMGVDNINVDSVYGSYSIQKRALRDRSLQLNNKKGIKTSHIIAGGLNDGKPGHEKWLALDSVANVIDYILHYPDHIPLLELRAGTEYL
jgi:hypothetical protein